MMKTAKKLVCLTLALGILGAAFTGCGGVSSGTDITIDENGNIVASADKATIQVWSASDGEEAARMKDLTVEFNKKYAKYNVQAVYTQKPSSTYETTMKATLTGESAPDVFYASDEYYKQWATLGFMENLDPYIKSNCSEFNMKQEIAGMFENTVGRYLYDVKTTTATGPEAHYYALPKGSGATAIYYNKNAFATSGIKIVSVYEKDLEAFNNGGKDAAGNTKQSLGITTTVKAVGYDKENKIFNNRISMNWEECADLAAYVQERTGVDYGFLTSWWFNYGFSVGGSCIGYVPSDSETYNGGYYLFTLTDATVNYKVKEGETVTVNGTAYEGNEILSFNDKFYLTDELAAKCDVLPSQRQAFAEYLSLSAKKNESNISGKAGITDTFKEIIPYKINGGISAYESALKSGSTDKLAVGEVKYRDITIRNKEVSPNPETFNSYGRAGYFISGKTAMIVEVRASVDDFRQIDDFDWDVAPMLTYRGQDKNGNEVSGIPAAHSGSACACVWSGSTVKNAAYLFVRFASGRDGQQILADAGTIVMNEKDLAQAHVDKEVAAGKKPANMQVFVDGAYYQTPGDWWFLSDGDWIDDWAQAVNQKVRNGKMTFPAFLTSSQYRNTFTTLQKYTKKK